MSLKRFDHFYTTVLSKFAFLSPIVAFFFMSQLSAVPWFNLTPINNPPTGNMWIRINFRFSAAYIARRKIFIVIFVMILPIVAFHLMHILPASRHLHHATVPIELALNHFFRITIFEMKGIKVALDVIQRIQSIFVYTQVFMHLLSPFWQSYVAADNAVSTAFQLTLFCI